jgi:hypothetical protein
MLTSALRRLHPGQANRRPALFPLEIAAALLAVLALRDVESRAPGSFVGGNVRLWAVRHSRGCGMDIGLREH